MQMRDDSIDFIKCVLILLVVLGHSMQYCMSQEGAYYLDMPLFVFIYSFHMQMFAFVSGLFVAKSLNMSFWNVFKKRFSQLIIPSIFWSGVVTNTVGKFIFGENADLEGVIKYFLYSPLAYWFLYSLFLSILCLWGANKIKEKSAFVVLISILLLFALPVNDLRWVKFIYPFYIAGYYFSLYKNTVKKHWKLVTSVAFMYLLQFVYRKYSSKMPSKIFLYIGRHSMAIYMIHFIVMNIWYRFVDVASFTVLGIYYSLYVILTFIVVTSVTVGFIYVIPSFKHRKLILGW